MTGRHLGIDGRLLFWFRSVVRLLTGDKLVNWVNLTIEIMGLLSNISPLVHDAKNSLMIVCNHCFKVFVKAKLLR